MGRTRGGRISGMRGRLLTASSRSLGTFLMAFVLLFVVFIVVIYVCCFVCVVVLC